MRWIVGIISFSLITAALSLSAEDSFAPPPSLSDDAFGELQKQSPFQRILNLEETFALQGVASVGDQTFITLRNRQSKKVITVNDAEANELGMKLVTVSAHRPETTKVTIAFAEEEVEFAYDEKSLDSSNFVPGRKDTIRRDKEGRIVTSEELIKKYYTMTKEQRSLYHKWRDQLLKARPELKYSEKRFPMAHKAIDAAKTGRAMPEIR